MLSLLHQEYREPLTFGVIEDVADDTGNVHEGEVCGLLARSLHDVVEIRELPSGHVPCGSARREAAGFPPGD